MEDFDSIFAKLTEPIADQIVHPNDTTLTIGGFQDENIEQIALYAKMQGISFKDSFNLFMIARGGLKYLLENINPESDAVETVKYMQDLEQNGELVDRFAPTIDLLELYSED